MPVAKPSGLAADGVAHGGLRERFVYFGGESRAVGVGRGHGGQGSRALCNEGGVVHGCVMREGGTMVRAVRWHAPWSTCGELAPTDEIRQKM